MAEPKRRKSAATLILTITYDDETLPNILDHAKEVIEKAAELAKVEGYIDLHRAERVFIEDLK